jgi:uncharacterized delta-60 repeat protein
MRAVRSQAARAIICASVLISLLPTSALAAPGDLDGTFGTGGVVSGAFGEDLVIQADGSIVTARSHTIGRVLYDGSWDASFGGDGLVVSWPDTHAIALQTDGRLVVAGERNGDVALARYLADGTEDASFSDDGHTRTDLGFHYDSAQGIALTPEGEILVAASGGFEHPYVLRYHPNGRLDRTFSGDGIARTPIKGNAGFEEILVQPDGKIVAVGTSSERCILARYRRDGRLDRTFGKDGVVVARGDILVRGGALQPDGKILAVGYCFNDRWRACLHRFRPNGAVDASFGGGDGRVTTEAGLSAFGEDVALQSDGKIVVVGSQDDLQALAIRYESDGSLDPDFGSGGIVVMDAEHWYAVAVPDDGAIVVGGGSLVRYLA